MNKFISSLKILPRWIIIILDLCIIATSVLLAYFLRFNFDLELIMTSNTVFGVVTFSITGFIAILITQSYSGIVRYTTLKDAMRISQVVLISTLLTLIISLVSFNFFNNRPIPLSVIIITSFEATVFLFLYRVLVKNMFSFYTSRVFNKKNIIIFGAGVSGSITKQVIENDTASSVRIVGFLEDDVHKIDKEIGGVKIYNANENLSDIFKELRVDELIISIQNLDVKRKNYIVDQCISNGVKIRTVPSVDKWISGELSPKQIRNVRIEDLLGRESIIMKNELIKNELKDKVVFVTGAAGSIGSEIVRQVLTYDPSDIVLIDQAESSLYELEREFENINGTSKIHSIIADITNKSYLEYLFDEYKPTMLYHAAAYKHVPMMEKNTHEAIRTNVFGTKNLVDLSLKYGVNKFVMISTDKAVNPTNIMGCSKRIAEMYVQSINGKSQSNAKHNTIFVITRFGNVLGSNGSVIPFFKKQLEEGGPLTVTHPEITRYFMTIQEACQLVLEAGTMGKGGEIFIFDMGESIKIVDLAKKMISLSGLELGKDIEIIFTGLREGEKLYEELLTDLENTTTTYHNKIMITSAGEQYEFVNADLIELKNCLENINEMQLVSHMKKMVPEYKSQYSRYEVLDDIS
ncbi:MAG TPA: nucleoside-diphosphate sugar epimerase/dehydratase [Fulvivirga sp.]|nr:nucleoside-diphosphate sugar epimerase/dehydratase [Fulvivirga sp.]